MRSLSVLLVFTLVFYTQQQVQQTAQFKADFQATLTECAQANAVDVSTVSIIWSQPDAPVNNNPLKCFYKCLITNFAIIDAGGNLNDLTLMSRFSYYDNATEVQEIGEKCKNVPTNSDLCEYSYQLLKCVALIELGQIAN